MKDITPDALFKYLKEVLNRIPIKALLHKAKTYKVFQPILSIVPSCGVQWGGLCYESGTIEISSWILKDTKVAKGVIRHELAHAMQDFLDIAGRPHGKEFIQVISPNNWRRDRHWQNTPAIQAARIKIHPKGGRIIVKPLTEYRTFKYAVTPNQTQKIL